MGKIDAAANPPAPNLEVSGRIRRHCPGCGSGGGKLVIEVPGDLGPAREMFAYSHCDCQTLSLINPDLDFSAYYGANYYSIARKRPGGLKGAAIRARNALTAFAPRPIADAVTGISEHPVIPQLRPILDGADCAHIPRTGSWLDIGCGAGTLLHDLREIGFTNLTGCDPFMREERMEPGFRLLRGDGLDLGERFDCVMMHHSLEHVPDPEGTLRALHRILSPRGVMLIRIPLCGSEPWRLHGGEWGNLDAPRHTTLWSRSGFVKAAQRSGWAMRRVTHDAKPRSLYSGEARLRGVSEGRAPGLFSPAEMRGFARAVSAQNAAGTSDAAAFYLTH